MKASLVASILVSLIIISAIVTALAIVPLGSVSMKAEEYPILKVVYYEVAGWNMERGDNNYYIISWVDEGGEIKQASINAKMGVIHVSSYNFVLVRITTMESFFGQQSIQISYEIYLTERAIEEAME